MAHWINWLANFGSPAPPPVKPEGEVRMEGDAVIYSARKGFRETVIDLTRLQYVYLYTTDSSRNLVLNDYHQHFIPCAVTGFEDFFKNLSGRLMLDEKKFFEALARNKPLKVELWRVDSPDNCRIPEFSEQAVQLGKELHEGFWVCDTPRQQISWDITSEALAALPFAYQTNNEYGITEIRFRYPVQLGNLVLDDWRYYLPVHLRLDVPLDSFYANLRVQGNGDQNYFLVRDALREVMGECTEAYERDDQNACHWLFGGLKFSLVYWYDGRSSYESGYAYLGVQNERAYPGYLIDQDYELNGTASKFLLFEQVFAIGSDFRRSHYFRQTPQIIAGKLSGGTGKFIIWRDEPNGKIGFANRENAMIFPCEILIGFRLQNVLPGRSSGGTYLSAVLGQGNPQSVLIGDCHALDGHVSEIAGLLRVPVTEITPYEE